MRILAIDPGYERLGIAILEKPLRGPEVLIYSDCFKTSAKLPFPERLLMIGKEVSRIIEEFAPEAAVLETLFFKNNQKTAMHVAEVRGVLIYMATERGIPIAEYTPLEIKMAIAGYGRGDKQQVIDMVRQLVKIEKEIRHDDEYDAIAVGLTYLAIARFPQVIKSATK